MAELEHFSSPVELIALGSLARSLVALFGRLVEVVIHDFSDLDHSVVLIEGNITGRSCGAPTTDLILQSLGTYGNQAPDLTNYTARTKTGRLLKCATTFVRDAQGQIIGCFCVNFDITDLVSGQQAFDELVRIPEAAPAPDENFLENVNDYVYKLVNDALGVVGMSVSAMTKADKLKIVGALDQKGAFLVKGTVELVANMINVSRYTLYAYLDECRASNTRRSH